MPTATGSSTPSASILMPNPLALQLRQSLQSSPRGVLLFQTAAGTTLGRLRFQEGRLLWAIAGQHRWRRWQRLLKQFCPHLEGAAIALPNRERTVADCEEFEVLQSWVQAGRLDAETAIRFLQQSTVEALFDLFQQAKQIAAIVDGTAAGLDQSADGQGLGQGLSERESGEVGLGGVGFPEAIALLDLAQQTWSDWCEAELAACSPDLAPVMRNAAALQQRTSPQTYRTLSSLLTGQSTLRDLAVVMKQDLRRLTKTLVAYTQWDLIGLSQVADTPFPFQAAASAPPAVAASSAPTAVSAPPQTAEAPLVLCIDDNPKVGEMMGKILTSAGYRYAHVQDSLEALTVLLEKKPEFVFLDLVMPVASGYEVCSQIRRIAAFKETPIVILTGNDGIIDRIRSKASGSTDFLSKPLEVQKVLAALRQYLPSDRIPAQATG